MVTYLFSFSILFLSPLSTCAAEDKDAYVPLISIPHISERPGTPIEQGGRLVNFFNSAYMLLVSIGAMIAVVKISMAGVKYSLSDVITDKSDARNDIRGSLVGLLILTVPYIVLKEINPDLVRLDVLRSAIPIHLTEKNQIPNTVTLGAGANATPAVREELINSCSSDLRIVNGGYCCGNATYTGQYKCGNTVSPNTNNLLQIDGGKVYNQGEINELLKNRSSDAVLVIGVTSRPDQAAQDCASSLPGSEPVLLKQAGGTTVGTRQFQDFLVCAK